MHGGNRDWLADIDRRYGELGRVLEIGSLNINGTARDHLEASEWVGIDIVDGAAVDIVCDAADTRFEPEQFDTLLSTSMLEHNPRWREGLSHNLQWLRSDGLFLLSWGAEGNRHHLPEPWALVPVGDVLEWCMKENLLMLDACWEASRYTADCPGCYGIVARKGLV